jgi:hypothetical protein
MGASDEEEAGRLRRGIAAALGIINSTEMQHDNLATSTTVKAVLEQTLGADQSGAAPKQRDSSPETPSPAIAGLIESGFRKVFVIRIARIAVPRRTLWPGLFGAAGSAALAASIPLVAELALKIAYPRLALHTMEAIGWVAALAIMTWSALLVGWYCLLTLNQGGEDIEQILSGTGDFQSAVSRWLRRSFRPIRQLTVASTVSACSCALLYLVEPVISKRVEISPVSYISVGWTGFLGGNGILWLIILTRLSRRIMRRENLNLTWYSPASTPAIILFSRVHTFGAIAILVAGLIMEMLALRVSAYGANLTLNILAISIPIIAVIGSFLFGGLPHWWLYHAVREARQRSLRALRPRSVKPPDSSTELAEAQGWVSLYTIVESSPGLPFSTGWAVQYAAAVLSTAIGTLLAIFFGIGQ